VDNRSSTSGAVGNDSVTVRKKAEGAQRVWNAALFDRNEESWLGQEKKERPIDRDQLNGAPAFYGCQLGKLFPEFLIPYPLSSLSSEPPL
jgi:DNA-damage-inducible protein J